LASYNYNTTVAQERALTLKVRDWNAIPSNEGAPNVTNTQYLKRRVDHQLDQLVDAMRNTRRETLEQLYEDASPATKASVNTTLGYTE
jgi:hypothetical protein